MKKRLYFDTSALLKEFTQEIGSDLVDTIIAEARQGRFEIITSEWSINETVAVMDKKVRREELSQVEGQTIIATLVERIKDSSASSYFQYAPLGKAIIANARMATSEFHISATDAIHWYTGFIYDCDYFVVHDSKFVNRLKEHQSDYPNPMTIDLESDKDRKYLRSELAL